MVPMERRGPGPLRGMQSLIALSESALQSSQKGDRQVRKVFAHTNITTHSDRPLTAWEWARHPSHYWIKEEGKGEIWKLTLSLKNSKFWDRHYPG